MVEWETRSHFSEYDKTVLGTTILGTKKSGKGRRKVGRKKRLIDHFGVLPHPRTSLINNGRAQDP